MRAIPEANMPLDPSQIAQHFDQYAATLERYAQQWTTSAADCVQEAFIQLACETAPPENAEAWLYRVVRNRALNAARSEARRMGHERAAREFSESQQPNVPTLDSAGQAELNEALDQLPIDQREIVVLRIWSGLTWREVAELVGRSSSSAQRDYVQALEKLRRRLETSCQTDSN